MQDFFLQNQSARLIENTIDQDAPTHLKLAKARYLQSVLPTPLIGTAGVVLMMCFIETHMMFQFELAIWFLLGLLVTYWRFYLLIGYSHLLGNHPPIEKLDSYLLQITGTSALAGITFGWGWISFYALLNPEIQLAFLFTNIVMLFGGLYAYSPHLPAFVAFSVLSLVPAIWQIVHNSQYWSVQVTGLGLVILVSQMFAYRWSQGFRHNVLLLSKNERLLSELSEKKESAEKATLAKSRFLAAVSHDLRQPLHAINLYLAVLRQTIAAEHDAHTVKTMVNHLNDSAAQLTHMFEGLLDISKLDSGTTTPSIINTPISQLVYQLAQEFSEIAASTGLAFQLKAPPKDMFEHIVVRTDLIMLERILRNLIANALSYTSTGGVRFRIYLKQRSGHPYLEFRVIDTGPGIERRERERIFEEFYQTDLARKRASPISRFEKNMGLGLSIANRLAGHLNTRIRLSSHMNLGSTFSFEIGVTGFQTLPQNLLQREDKAQPQENCLKGLYAVVVDDTPEILQSTQQLLSLYGADGVLTASNVQQMWTQLAEWQRAPDAFLIDYEIENESGIEVIRAIKNKYGDQTRCILITGETSAEVVSFFEKERLQVLYKPLNADKLINAVLGVTKASQS